MEKINNKKQLRTNNADIFINIAFVTKLLNDLDITFTISGNKND